MDHEKRQPNRKDEKWWTRYEELRSLIAREQQGISAPIFDSERNAAGQSVLEMWVRNQRRRNLTDAKQRALNALPGFEWEPLQAKWDRRLREYDLLTAQLTHPPRHRGHTVEERRSADWFGRQVRLERSGQLPHVRAVKVRERYRRLSAHGD